MIEWSSILQVSAEGTVAAILLSTLKLFAYDRKAFGGLRPCCARLGTDTASQLPLPKFI